MDAGCAVETYTSPRDLLQVYEPERPGCLVLDLRLPEMSGLELRSELQRRGGHHPFIMITGHGDVPKAVEAMREGAVDFLEKPFSRGAFLQRVWEAIERDAAERRRRAVDEEIEQRVKTLSPDVHEVLAS